VQCSRFVEFGIFWTHDRNKNWLPSLPLSDEGIVLLSFTLSHSVCLCVCLCCVSAEPLISRIDCVLLTYLLTYLPQCHISLCSEGNALYPVLSSVSF